MELQKLYKYCRKAIDQYHMIEPGDRIAIGISGGKDSLTLLYALAGLKHFYPHPFEIVGITVSLGLEEMDFSPVVELCAELGVPHHTVSTEIFETVFHVRKEKNPCSLCAKMRKGAFNQKALELGCNKIAYAHHKDDLIETLYLSLMFEGRIGTFSPVTHLDKTGLTLIRPMMLVPEAEIKSFRYKQNLPVVKNLCPADGYTKRQYVKDLLKSLEQDNREIKDRAFAAIVNARFQDWPE